MKVVGVMCGHETIYQIMVQNVTELRPKVVNGTQIEYSAVYNKP